MRSSSAFLESEHFGDVQSYENYSIGAAQRCARSAQSDGLIVISRILRSDIQLPKYSTHAYQPIIEEDIRRMFFRRLSSEFRLLAGEQEFVFTCDCDLCSVSIRFGYGFSTCQEKAFLASRFLSFQLVVSFRSGGKIVAVFCLGLFALRFFFTFVFLRGFVPRLFLLFSPYKFLEDLIRLTVACGAHCSAR